MSTNQKNTISSLRALVPFVGTLVTIATNPEQWLRQFVFGLIAEWVVGGIIDTAEYILGWVFYTYDVVKDAILGIIPPLTSPFRIVEGAVVGAIAGVYDAAQGVAITVGLAGPPAAAFAIAIVLTMLAVVLVGALRVIPGSDAVEGALGRFT